MVASISVCGKKKTDLVCIPFFIEVGTTCKEKKCTCGQKSTNSKTLPIVCENGTFCSMSDSKLTCDVQVELKKYPKIRCVFMRNVYVLLPIMFRQQKMNM